MNKKQYREFCKTEKNMPIFSKDWWLDCVCSENEWDVVLVKRDNKIVASLPYMLLDTQDGKNISMPKLTQTMGLYIKYPKNQKYYKKLSWEEKMVEEAIVQLPKIGLFWQSFHHSFTNALPFYWNGFSQVTRYTYIIENTSLELLEREFETDTRRRRRRKAEKLTIKIVQSDDIEKFYELNIDTFKRQNIDTPYSFEFLNNLYKVCKENNSIKLLLAKYQDEYIAGGFFIYDDNSVYYLAGGIQENKKNLGAMDAVIYEGIKFALQSGRQFDFEGSMIRSIERYFRSFGAIQKPYFSIKKIFNEV